MRPGCIAALSLLLLAATRAAAEPPPPPSAPPLVEVPPPAEAPPAAVDVRVSVEEKSAFNRWPRIGVEAFTGAGLAVVGGLAFDELGRTESWIFLGAPLGMLGGIMAGGALMDGNGSWMAVIGGELGGMLAGALVGSAFSQPGNQVPLYVALSVLTLGGGVMMYELSSDDRRSETEAEQALRAPRSPPVRVAPYLAPTAEGRGALAGILIRL